MRDRLHRSELTVPGSNLRAIAKAATLDADVVMFDLEDSVAATDKELARAQVISALLNGDWLRCSTSVRINGLDTPWWQRDIAHVLEQTAERVDLLVIPKVGQRADVEQVADFCEQIEQATGYGPVHLALLIESALGLVKVEEIAQACPERVEAIVFGPGDFAASVRARTTSIGGPNRDYAVLTDEGEGGTREWHWGDQWHYALARIVTACRAYGLRPIDGPFADFHDPDGFVASARRGAALGCDGKWVIHPSQIELANEAFSPTEIEIARARRIVEAMRQGAEEGVGAISLDGTLVDAASIRMAENVLSRVDQIERRRL